MPSAPERQLQLNSLRRIMEEHRTNQSDRARMTVFAALFRMDANARLLSGMEAFFRRNNRQIVIRFMR
jgi:hypothetical protein